MNWERSEPGGEYRHIVVTRLWSSFNLLKCTVRCIPRSTLSWMLVLLLVGLLSSCGSGSQYDVPKGAFTARVEGGLADTLTGAAVYRVRDSALVGLELGSEEGPGLSMELEPRPLEPRTYEVVDRLRPRPSGPTGAVVFLTMGSARLTATGGTVNLTAVRQGEVDASFDLEMSGAFEGSPRALTVRVRGSVRAIAE